MNTTRVEESLFIPAPAEAVYAVLSDYRVGHPAILPKPYFVDLVVEEGGQGAGTKIRVEMNVMGAKRTMRMVVTEPEPGRVLAEEDAENGLYTTFTFEPIQNGQQTHLTIATDMKTRPGLAGFIERLMTTPMMHRIYRQELQQIVDYMQRSQPA